MATKVISVSLPESLEWKLTELEKRSGVSRSGIIQRALLLFVSETESYTFPGGQAGYEVTEEDIDDEYQKSQGQV